ncbi:Crp/Fnr family transcriptional regulator [Flavobacterium sp. ASW18X]|uniref:Crp/Fnr family transcriptional regulator n=1 Tax=Flavobacterium sp. ASW18X TaxID=2572595 RepID=UPI0010AE2D9A|nr:Crp/Fnr family transcriptional regulator [Flavobacterium sp. ASW18X]TKD61908.1 Crp/Fnr family transcriptional regulator [Flavobacterium sp. ASW18X]
MDTHCFLHQIFKPENFSVADLQLITEQFTEVDFAKNDTLIESGKPANYYYFLESGYLRSSIYDTHGNDITTKFFCPLDIVIDWNAYFLKQPCKERIVALTEGKAWRITFTNFMKLFHIEAFREVGRTRLVNSYFELKNHSLAVIAEPAKDRYLRLMQQQPALLQHAPLKHLATYLGITDTSLSRIRKEIVKTP